VQQVGGEIYVYSYILLQ